jgi:SAM-dependent methyltransferase
VTRKQVAEKLASLFEGRAMQGYARWKVRTDPAYAATLENLRGRTTPLLDLGCGVGLLAFFLREHGYTAPVTGIDFDRRKIDIARRISNRYRDLQFLTGDARDPFPPPPRDVVILDLLQYFDAEAQRAILTRAAKCGGVVIIRQGLRDGSWRHRVTVFVDALGRAVRWMKAERVNFPTREDMLAPFANDFEVEVRPLWGRTPYNNYLFVCRPSSRRSSSGTTSS